MSPVKQILSNGKTGSSFWRKEFSAILTAANRHGEQLCILGGNFGNVLVSTELCKFRNVIVHTVSQPNDYLRASVR
jgi:hypothetical protein